MRVPQSALKFVPRPLRLPVIRAVWALNVREGRRKHRDCGMATYDFRWGTYNVKCGWDCKLYGRVLTNEERMGVMQVFRRQPRIPNGYSEQSPLNMRAILDDVRP